MRMIYQNARILRNNATDAERRLWRALRGRQLFGCKFRRQFPIAGYIADFACLEARLVIELDGGQHIERAQYDAERTSRLMANGYKVLRFWNDDVLLRIEAVLEDVCRELQPLPNPPLHAGEGAKSKCV